MVTAMVVMMKIVSMVIRAWFTFFQQMLVNSLKLTVQFYQLEPRIDSIETVVHILEPLCST